MVKVEDQTQGGISQNYDVLSVRSGSTGIGGHVCMYLKFQDHRTAGARGAVPIIRREHAQLWDANGSNTLNKDHLMRGEDTRLLQTHHTSYVLDAKKNQRRSLRRLSDIGTSHRMAVTSIIQEVV